MEARRRGAKRTAELRKEFTDKFYQPVFELIQQYRATKMPYVMIADVLNSIGLRNAIGGEYHPVMIYRIEKRFEQ